MTNEQGQVEKRSQPLAHSSPEVLIPFTANLVVAFVGFYVGLSVIVQEGLAATHFVIVLVFSVILLGSAFGIWARKRVAYAVSILASIIFLAQDAPNILGLFGLEATYPVSFYSAIIGFPLIVLSLVSSIFGFRALRRKAEVTSAGRKMINIPTMVALLVIGFIIGGALIGALAADTESRLLASSGGTAGADIVIVPGAANSPQPYSPSTFTAKVGTTVTWVNNDNADHTVTSTTGLFDSGPIPPGGMFSFTFSQAGTYQYYCTPHPWMKGTINVTSG